MNKKLLAFSSIILLFALGAGCVKNSEKMGETGQVQPGKTGNEWTPKTLSPEAYDDSDQIFEDAVLKISFHYRGYLQKTNVKTNPGSVSIIFRRREGSNRPIDTLYFSAKTRAAALAEKAKAPKNLVCESFWQEGCDRYDDDLVLYNRAMSQNSYDGYFAFGGNRVTLNGITYVVVVDYNLERQQYQTRYIGFINNTRIMFMDPATGGLEYGVPFQMNARNREMIEKTGAKIAKRLKIDDMNTVTRADALYQIVSTVKLAR